VTESDTQRPEPRDSIPMAIANAVVGLTREYTGRGATKARAIVSDDAVMVLMADLLTKAERRLADAGKHEKVLDLRHAFQDTMRADLTAAVEKILERKVIAFMSANHIDPDMAVEVFVLEPVSAG
jgi:uncharacterized protein YbcI